MESHLFTKLGRREIEGDGDGDGDGCIFSKMRVGVHLHPGTSGLYVLFYLHPSEDIILEDNEILRHEYTSISTFTFTSSTHAISWRKNSFAG